MDLLKELHKKSPTLRGVLNTHLSEIKQGLLEGYTKKEIYNLLKDSKLIKSDYVYFVRILKQLLNEGNKTDKTESKGKTSSSIPKKKSFTLRDLSEDELD